MNVVSAACGAVDLPQEIKQPGVHLGRLVAPPVAQEPVDLVEPRTHIAPVALVGDLGALLGVDEVEFERARLGAGRAGGRKHNGERQEQACEHSVPGERKGSPSPNNTRALDQTRRLAGRIIVPMTFGSKGGPEYPF